MANLRYSVTRVTPAFLATFSIGGVRWMPRRQKRSKAASRRRSAVGSDSVSMGGFTDPRNARWITELDDEPTGIMPGSGTSAADDGIGAIPLSVAFALPGSKIANPENSVCPESLDGTEDTRIRSLSH